MKLHMRFDTSNEQHTRITFFINGQNCGQLCVGTIDAIHLHMILSHGMVMPDDEFISSGMVYKRSDNGD